ncbi:MAG: zinc ribbon domain-containing protein [Candidatus Bathyarchaeota archaeon]|nr:zinc ribbon domain-containing protein [Candidatus Bathyarchaeota archaeon]
MVSECPKCKRKSPVDSVYCPYCGRGMKPSARSTQVSVGGALMIVATVANLIFFVFAFQAIINIHRWYPPLVAQIWFAYDQFLVMFFFTGLLFGLCTAVLSLSRKSYRWTLASAMLCMLSGGGAWIISMIVPHSSIVQSLLYYFFPLLVAPFAGAVLIFLRSAEFQ